MSGWLVIGVGNDGAGDDGAGPAVVRGLAGRLPAGWQVASLRGDPSRLLDLWSPTDDVIVVDAAMGGRPPGTVRRFDASAGPLPAELRGGPSSHAVGTAQAVELARALRRLPHRLVVYAIEGRRFEAGAPLSPAVAAAVERVVEEIARAAVAGAALRGDQP